MTSQHDLSRLLSRRFARNRRTSRRSRKPCPKRVEGDRTREGDAAGPKIETKKARASRPAVGTSVVEPETPSATEAPRRVEGHGKTMPMKTGDGKATDGTVVPKKTIWYDLVTSHS